MRLRNGRLLALVGLALLLSACQVLVPRPPAQPRLLIDRAALAPTTVQSDAGDVNYTVKRGTIVDALSVPGKVVPARSAQLTFPNAGTVSVVHVRAGQTVQKDDPLVVLALSDEALDAARTQAMLAELASESQRAKVAELRAGAGAAKIEDARAGVARARAALGEAEQAREAGAEPSDREVQLAQLALEQARDDLAQEQTLARRAQDQVELDAQAAAARVHTAEFALREASIKLDQALADQSVAEASRRVNTQTIRLEQAQDDLKEARAAEARAPRTDADDKRSVREADVDIAAAAAGTRGATRKVALEAITLEQLQADRDKARVAYDTRAKLAQLAQEQARDELVGAQAAERRAKEAPDSAQRGNADEPARDAAARVRVAERRVQMAAVKLEGAQGELAAEQAARKAKAGLAGLQVEARKAELAAAEALLAELQSGARADTIEREEKRAALLLGQADAARARAEPEVVLKAPFDGTVTSVAATAGQLVDARATAVYLAGEGGLAVVANASESEVAQLPVDRAIEVAFPGLGNESGAGTIVEISGFGNEDKDGRVTFPFRVNLTQVPRGVRIGMTALANFTLREARNVLYVPSRALRTVDGQSLVTRVGLDGEPTDVPVLAGDPYGSDVEILHGLEEGDVVMVFAPPKVPTESRR